MWYENLLEKNLLPEFLIRFGIKVMLKRNSKNEPKELVEKQKYLMEFINKLKEQPIAIHTDKPNIQHYEVPSDFFKLVLGENLKYSCCFWENKFGNIKSAKNLTHAEERMLNLTVKRAEVKDGEKILELGCGWGSLSLFLAKKYPKAKITAVTNSKTQKEFIDKEIRQNKIDNLEIIKQDVQFLEINRKFDKIISIEMFEHMRNYEKLLENLSKFLVKDGKLFVHIFSRKENPFLFHANNSENWMAKYFFTGGTMPSANLLLYFAKNFGIEKHWIINGKQYSNTLESWLWKMKGNKKEIMAIFERVYGKEQKRKWWVFWKLFFIANSISFGYKNGEEYFVSHYLFRKK